MKPLRSLLPTLLPKSEGVGSMITQPGVKVHVYAPYHRRLRRGGNARPRVTLQWVLHLVSADNPCLVPRPLHSAVVDAGSTTHTWPEVFQKRREDRQFHHEEVHCSELSKTKNVSGDEASFPFETTQRVRTTNTCGVEGSRGVQRCVSQDPQTV